MLRKYSLIPVLVLTLQLTSLCVNDAKQNAPVFMVRNYTVHESFDEFLGILAHLPWFASNGYQIPLPSNPVFKDLAEHPEKIKSIDREAYFKIFASEIYAPCDLVPMQERLTQGEPTLSAAMERLHTLNTRWNFKIFPRYEIILFKYGPGGGYNPSLGHIEVNITDNNFPSSYRALSERIIHEAVHMGIESIIVQKFRLTQWEKEGLVDLICSLYLGDLLPDYYMQEFDDTKILKFITADDIYNDLPGAIERYVAQCPRQQ